jgi:Tfp pilus assembly protein PilO
MTKPFWQRRLLPAFVALAVLNGVVLLAWTLPRSLRQKNAAERAVAARVEVERERERLAAQRQRSETIRANRVDLEHFYGSLAGSEKQDLLPTLEAIEELVKAPGLQPSGRQIRREEVEKTPLEQVTVTMPIEGSYAELVGFLRGVERSPRFLTVDSVALRADREVGGALQVELSTYLRRPAGARRERRRGR